MATSTEEIQLQVTFQAGHAIASLDKFAKAVEGRLAQIKASASATLSGLNVGGGGSGGGGGNPFASATAGATAAGNAINALNAKLHSAQASLFGFVQLGNVLQQAVTQPLIDLSKFAADSAITLQSAKLQLQSLFSPGEAKKDADGFAIINEQTNKIVRDLTKLAELPGIDLTGAISGVAKFKALNVDLEKSTSLLRQLSNAVALSGGSASDLNEVVRQLSQIAGQGKIAGDELRIISERIPIIRKVLQGEFGTAVGKEITKKLAAEGQGIEDFLDRLTKGLAELPKAIPSFKDKLENLRIELEQAAAPFGEAILRALIPALQAITPFIKQLGESFAALSPTMQQIILGGLALAAAIGPIITVFGTLALSITSIISLLTLFSPAIAAAAAGGLTATGVFGALTGAVSATSAAIFVFLTTNPVGWLILAAAAVTAAVVAYKLFSKTVEETTSSINQSIATTKDQAKSARDLANEVKNLAEQSKLGKLEQEKVNAIYSKLTPIQQARVNLLAKESGETDALSGRLVGLIKLLDAEAEARRLAAIEEQKKAGLNFAKVAQEQSDAIKDQTFRLQGVNAELDKNKAKLEENIRVTQKANETGRDQGSMFNTNISTAQNYQNQIVSLNAQSERLKGLNKENSDALQKIAASMAQAAIGTGLTTNEFIRQSVAAAGLRGDIVALTADLIRLANFNVGTPDKDAITNAPKIDLGLKKKKNPIPPGGTGGRKADPRVEAKAQLEAQLAVIREGAVEIEREQREADAKLEDQRKLQLISEADYYTQRENLQIEFLRRRLELLGQEEAITQKARIKETDRTKELARIGRDRVKLESDARLDAQGLAATRIQDSRQKEETLRQLALEKVKSETDFKIDEIQRQADERVITETAATEKIFALRQRELEFEQALLEQRRALLATLPGADLDLAQLDAKIAEAKAAIAALIAQQSTAVRDARATDIGRANAAAADERQAGINTAGQNVSNTRAELDQAQSRGLLGQRELRQRLAAEEAVLLAKLQVDEKIAFDNRYAALQADINRRLTAIREAGLADSEEFRKVEAEKTRILEEQGNARASLEGKQAGERAAQRENERIANAGVLQQAFDALQNGSFIVDGIRSAIDGLAEGTSKTLKAVAGVAGGFQAAFTRVAQTIASGANITKKSLLELGVASIAALGLTGRAAAIQSAIEAALSIQKGIAQLAEAAAAAATLNFPKATLHKIAAALFFASAAASGVKAVTQAIGGGGAAAGAVNGAGAGNTLANASQGNANAEAQRKERELERELIIKLTIESRTDEGVLTKIAAQAIRNNNQFRNLVIGSTDPIAAY